MCVCLRASVCVAVRVCVCNETKVHGRWACAEQTTCWTSKVNVPWMTTDDGNIQKMNRKHPVSRTDSAVGARSSSTRISVLVGKRQVVDEIDFRLCVRRLPLVNEGRHDCNAARRPALTGHGGQACEATCLRTPTCPNPCASSG